MKKRKFLATLLIMSIFFINCNLYSVFAQYNEIKKDTIQNSIENNNSIAENTFQNESYENKNTSNEIEENVSNSENIIEPPIINNGEKDEQIEDESNENIAENTVENTAENTVENTSENTAENISQNTTQNNTIEEESNVYELKSNLMMLNEENQILAEQTIQDGVYVIASGLDESKVLDISGASTEDSANVQIWANDKVDQQKFRVTYLNNGYYKITSVKSDKVLDVADGGKTNGTNVQQYNSNNTYAQQWIIKSTGDGFFNIISRCNNLYMDVANGSTSNGTNVQVYEGNNTNAQKFKFILAEEFNGTQTLEDGIYTISSALDSNKVLDISAASTNSGANVQLWSSTQEVQQKFIIRYLENGYYIIENFNSEKVLDVADGSKKNGANVWQYEKNNTNAQKWVIKDVGNGYYNIISKCGGLYLDVANGSTSNGTNVQLYEGNNTNAQKFKFEKDIMDGQKTISNGTYIIASKLNTNKVLDISGASKNSGENVQIWENVREKQQEFLINYLGNGFYQIVNVNSGKSLDVSGGAKTSGTNVWQYDINNTKSQQWIIKSVGDGYYNIISRCNELYLDVNGGYTSNGTNVQVYEGNDTNAQKFKFIKTEKDGIDVSKFQGNINWSSVKNENVDFAIHRVGLRGYETGKIVEDTMFEKNIVEAEKQGIDCGVYFVTQAINYNEGVEEANWVLDHIKGYNIVCPIAIDVEWAGGGQGNNGRADNISKEERTQAVKGFCDTIKNAGYIPMIYANKDWLTNYLDMNVLYDYNVWLAHYVKGAPSNKSDYEGNYIYWQYTSKGNINGINGYVDLNKGY